MVIALNRFCVTFLGVMPCFMLVSVLLRVSMLIAAMVCNFALWSLSISMLSLAVLKCVSRA